MRFAGRALRLLVGAVLCVAVAFGVDWSGTLGTYLPCRRNWAWAPSYQPRASPTQSTVFALGRARLKLCYGSPRARGRKMIGGSPVPFGRLWRTGANEPTTLRLGGPVTLAGLAVPAGKVSLYTVPGPETWEIVVNRSTGQWGIESEYTSAVAAAEIGRRVVASTRAAEYAEALAISFEPGSGSADGFLVLRWETTEVRIPIAAK